MMQVMLLADISLNLVVDPLVGVGLVGTFALWAVTVVWFASAANQRLKGIEANTSSLPARVVVLETDVKHLKERHK